MSRVLLAVAVLAVTIYCLIDCVQTDESDVRHLPKLAWLLMILLFPVVGSAAWLIAGRPRSSAAATRRAPRPAPPRNLAPDDDPSFLASLDATNEERRRLAQWERELKDREERLRGDRAERADEPEQDGPDESRSTRS